MTDDQKPFSNALIVVIDDEVTQRLITRDTLEQEGFRVEEAPNGEDGLRLIRDLRPDLVLLDIMMPGIDGFEVCRQLRADPTTCHTPVIIVTGREDTADIRTGFAVGATDFLTKPVVWNLLPSRIRYVLKMSRLEQDLRLAKEAAENANAAKSTLLSTMGHELRTPLNAIIGFSDLMKQAAFGPIGPPQYQEFIADIHAAGTQLLGAINSILEIVNCESGDTKLSRQDISVVDLVGHVVSQVGSEAQASGIQILNDVSDTAIRVNGDEARLKKALFCLVSNAVKFTEQGGLVRLGMRRSADSGLVLTVEDNGIGISEEDLPRVMEPFEQADASLSRNFEGLGLGIPLACALVRLHGGDVRYESESGKGTTVSLALPASCVTLSGEDLTAIQSA